MSTIIVCDGGCGAQSPNPRTGLHDANGWLVVRASYQRPFESVSSHDDKTFCKACAQRVLDALKPAAALSEKS